MAKHPKCIGCKCEFRGRVAKGLPEGWLDSALLQVHFADLNHSLEAAYLALEREAKIKDVSFSGAEAGLAV